MKITALRLREFRKFTQPVSIEGLGDGLNLLYGPNEAGKSTLAQAIRTLFFERHGTSGEAFAQAIAPHGLQAASPQVEIDFELDGQNAQASKTFLQRPRASLRIGSQQWDSAEAEDMLASRLGFSFSGRGASRADKHGIPGLLWVEQGSSAELDAPVSYASDALQAQLKGVLGEMGGGQASRILQAVGEPLAKLRTATGRDSGELQQASKDLAQASAQLQQLDERAQQLRSQTDALAHLLAQQRQSEQEKPWEAAEAKKQQAQQQLAALQPRQQSLQAQRERHAELERRIAALHTQQETRQKELQALAALQAQQSQAQALQQQAADALQAAQAQTVHAQQQHGDALAQQRAASARQSHDELSAQLQRCQADIADITQRLAREQERSAQLDTLHRQLGAIQIDKSALKALEKLERQWQDARLQREAVATRITLRLRPGKSITAGALGALQGSSEHLLTAPLTLHIDGIGEIDITPGGTQDVLRLAQTEHKLAQQLANALQRLGVDSVATAQQRHADAQTLQQQIQHLQTESAAQLQARDPTDWQRSLAELQGQQQALTQQLAELPTLPQEQNLPTPTTAQRLLDKAQKQWQEAQAQLDELRAQASAAQLNAQTLASRITAEQERLHGDKAEENALQQQRDLAEALTRRESLNQQIAEAETTLAAQQPQQLEADIQRYERTLAALAHERSERDKRIAALRAELQTLGGEGIDEQLAQAREQQQRCDRRLAALRLRADALTLLQQRLQQGQQAQVERLYAPLRQRLEHYLHLLFPDAAPAASVAQLRPTELQRHGTNLALREHSLGTREQLGVIARLAYADLLQQAGQPTLLILDDALVHSDAQRREQMKRILHDAASRHQILLLTCHPEHWRDAGAARMVDVAALASQGS